MFNLFHKQIKQYSDLGAEDFHQGIQDKDAVVIDVRTAGEFNQGKLPKARNLDMMSPNFKQQIQNLPKDKSYYLYCRSGNRSGHACAMMADLGFEKVYNLAGGIISWPY
ncbi:rhodanese-like domain-containing protein [Cyclobacterium plantarum]|uniref:Rhodanese-like domain-containing protein n=1 Tax=Cyclobacterium plantarum TaxID=2716263 RepID=A0ABX0HG16_9BACT|nr:rhodanese-like domain-containing protein [Cyclobacterium plantarum]NHE59537.1 rhodanese-like domain-containing protein [Cyclobacterium plantarum]